jgi:hypothetical protein
LLKDCSQPAIVLKDVSYNHLQHVMTYIYCGSVEIEQNEVATFRSILSSLKIVFDEEIDEDYSDPEIIEPVFEEAIDVEEPIFELPSQIMYPNITIKEEPKSDYSIKEEIAPEMLALDENHMAKTSDEKIRIQKFRKILNFPGHFIKPAHKIIRILPPPPVTDGKISIERVVPSPKIQKFMTENPMICPFCRKLFKTTKHRNEHVKYCFDNPNRIVSNCHICGKSVCDPYYLRKHLRNVHGIAHEAATNIATSSTIEHDNTF